MSDRRGRRGHGELVAVSIGCVILAGLGLVTSSYRELPLGLVILGVLGLVTAWLRPDQRFGPPAQPSRPGALPATTPELRAYLRGGAIVFLGISLLALGVGVWDVVIAPQGLASWMGSFVTTAMFGVLGVVSLLAWRRAVRHPHGT